MYWACTLHFCFQLSTFANEIPFQRENISQYCESNRTLIPYPSEVVHLYDTQHMKQSSFDTHTYLVEGVNATPSIMKVYAGYMDGINPSYHINAIPKTNGSFPFEKEFTYKLCITKTRVHAILSSMTELVSVYLVFIYIVIFIVLFLYFTIVCFTCRASTRRHPNSTQLQQQA